MAVDNKIRINVKVGDRVFPMTINPEEERNIRIAAEQVTEMDNRYRNKITDGIDRLSIVALQMAIQSIKSGNSDQIERATDQLQKLCDAIDDTTKI